jgi:hypothetical protein
MPVDGAAKEVFIDKQKQQSNKSSPAERGMVDKIHRVESVISNSAKFSYGKKC